MKQTFYSVQTILHFCSEVASCQRIATHEIRGHNDGETYSRVCDKHTEVAIDRLNKAWKDG
jgi:hypothetical protein